MTMNNKLSTDNLDLLWIGCDKNGYLGSFTSAGEGPVPSILLKNHGLDELLEIERTVLQLPIVSDFVFLQAGTSWAKTIKAPMAERGFYEFDWDDVHAHPKSKFKKQKDNSYNLQAKPKKPLMISALSNEVIAKAKIVKFNSIDYGTLNKLPEIQVT